MALGVFSQTTYFSRGAWLETRRNSARSDNLAYSLDAYYYTDPGFRPNNDFHRQLGFLRHCQVSDRSPKDTVFFQVQLERTEVDAGDVLEHYKRLPDGLRSHL